MERKLECLLKLTLSILVFVIAVQAITPYEVPISVIIISLGITIILYAISKDRMYLLALSILLGYFTPTILQYFLPPSLSSALLSMDYIVLKDISKPFGIEVFNVQGSIWLVKGNEVIGRYILPCSSLKALTALLYPLLVTEIPLTRRIAASLAGFIVMLPVPWIRLYVMYLTMKVLGISLELAHYTINPTVTTLWIFLVLIVQWKIAEELRDTITDGLRKLFLGWQGCWGPAK